MYDLANFDEWSFASNKSKEIAIFNFYSWLLDWSHK